MEKEDFQYTIVMKDGNIGKDWNFFMSLYAPIVGAKATALYFGLVNEKLTFHELSKLDFDSQRLYQITSLSPKGFADSLKKLESLKLINTKISLKKKMRRFELFAPLEPEEFFSNKIFEKALLSKIGPMNVEALKYVFKETSEPIDKEDEFEDVTANFEDVFGDGILAITDSTISDEDDETTISTLRTTKRTLLEKSFNLEELNRQLKKAKINLNYASESTRSALNSVIPLYNFTESDFVNLIIDSYDFDEQELLPAKFANVANIFIKKKRKELSNQTLINNQKSVNEWLNDHRVDLNESIKKLIETLGQKYQFNDEIIIELLEFSNYVNQGRVIPNYLYKVADTLINQDINSLEMVRIFLTNQKQYRQNQGEKEFINNLSDYPNSPIPTFDDIMNLVYKS